MLECGSLRKFCTTSSSCIKRVEWMYLEVEASYEKVTQATTIKRNPLLPFSHTFGLNTAFCYCIVATGVV